METPRKYGKDAILNEIDGKINDAATATTMSNVLVEVSKEEVLKADTTTINIAVIDNDLNNHVPISGNVKVNEKGRTDGDAIDDGVTEGDIIQTKINPTCNVDVLTDGNEIGNEK